MGIVGTEIVRYDGAPIRMCAGAWLFRNARRQTHHEVKAMDVAGESFLPFTTAEVSVYDAATGACNEVSPWSRGEE